MNTSSVISKQLVAQRDVDKSISTEHLFKVLERRKNKFYCLISLIFYSD